MVLPYYFIVILLIIFSISCLWTIKLVITELATGKAKTKDSVYLRYKSPFNYWLTITIHSLGILLLIYFIIDLIRNIIL